MEEEVTMNVSELKRSKFMTRHDVGKGMLCTIRVVSQQNVSKEGAEDELRFALEFDEHDKPFILNSTNGQLIASILGSEESDDWIGKQIVLYDDPTISFAGRITGGIRVRASRKPQPVVAKTRTTPAPVAVDPGAAQPGETHPADAIDNLPF